MKRTKRRPGPFRALPCPPVLDWRDLAAVVWTLGVIVVFLRQLLEALTA